MAKSLQYDGSDSGARPDEAVSWGKIRAGAESVKASLPTPWLTGLLTEPGVRRCYACVPTRCGRHIRTGSLGRGLGGTTSRQRPGGRAMSHCHPAVSPSCFTSIVVALACISFN